MTQLVAKPAPDFTSAAVLADGTIVEDFNFTEWRNGRHALVLFYPLDFTFVCPSELIALHHRMKEFEDRGVAVCTVSVDSHFTHNAWRNTAINDGGIGAVDYPMVADINHAICQAYGVELEEAGVAFRGSFITDKDGIVHHASVNNLPIGRDIDELLRLVDALQFHEEHGEVCPAGWQKGKAGMTDTPDGVAAYLAENSEGL